MEGFDINEMMGKAPGEMLNMVKDVADKLNKELYDLKNQTANPKCEVLHYGDGESIDLAGVIARQGFEDDLGRLKTKLTYAQGGVVVINLTPRELKALEKKNK